MPGTLGMIALRQGNARLAAQHIERSLEPRAHSSPGTAQPVGRPATARPTRGGTQRVEQASPSPPIYPLNNRGNLLLDLKRVEEGLQDIDRALRDSSLAAPSHYNNRGHALMLRWSGSAPPP